MRRTAFAYAVAVVLTSLTVAPPAVAAEQSWELVPPFPYTSESSESFARATASPDGRITASATAGGSFFYSAASGSVGGRPSWTTAETKYRPGMTLSVTATIEITSATLVGPGASAWVGVSTVNAWGTGDWCGEQAIGDADAGTVVTITCTLDDVRSGDVVAAYASAWSSDTVLYLMGSVQASYSTANIDVVVRRIIVSGSDLW